MKTYDKNKKKYPSSSSSTTSRGTSTLYRGANIGGAPSRSTNSSSSDSVKKNHINSTKIPKPRTNAGSNITTRQAANREMAKSIASGLGRAALGIAVDPAVAALASKALTKKKTEPKKTTRTTSKPTGNKASKKRY